MSDPLLRLFAAVTTVNSQGKHNLGFETQNRAECSYFLNIPMNTMQLVFLRVPMFLSVYMIGVIIFIVNGICVSSSILCLEFVYQFVI